MWLKIITIAMAGFLALGCDRTADHKAPREDIKPVRWKLAGTYSSNLVMIGTMGKRIEREINRVSGGNMQLHYFEPGALVPPLEVFDAISYGAIDAGWSTPGYWAGKVPALQMFGSVPFGPDAGAYMGWYYYGGGKEIFEDIYHRHNIHSIVCGMSPPEASGWFKKEIKTLDDLKGLKIRFFGLGAKVLDRLGVSTQLLSGGDIFPALELGAIDGTEFSMPAVDYDLGFYQVAKHYYFPGWHQQSTFFDLMVNLEEWNALAPNQQAMLETVCGDNVRNGIAEGEALQADAILKLKEKGVIFHKWPPEILEALETEWRAVATELAAQDPDFKRALDSLNAFREKHKTWQDLGYLKE